MTFAETRRARSEDRRISPVFWVLLAVLGTSGWAVWSGYGGDPGVGVFLFVISGWMVSLCLHEYGHARTALHGGDTTIGAKGYLTLNPLKYTNVLFSFVLPVVFVIMGGIGLPGGAVYIERHRIRGRLRHSLISAAGPLVNVVFAAVLLTVVGAGWFEAQQSHAYQDGLLKHSAMSGALAYLAMFQVSAALLNLLPVPGLDGYGIVEPWLSPGAKRAVEPFAPYGMLAVFALLWQPQVNRFFFDAVYAVTGLFGVGADYIATGDYLFRFWSH